MPDDPLPEVAAFQAFLTGRVWVFGDKYDPYATKWDNKLIFHSGTACNVVKAFG